MPFLSANSIVTEFDMVLISFKSVQLRVTLGMQNAKVANNLLMQLKTLEN